MFELQALIPAGALLLIIGLIVLVRIGKKHNKTDWGQDSLNVLDGINYWFCRHYHRLSQNLINLPQSGPIILVCNHISGLDPLLLIAATNRPLRFMIAQEEYDRWWLKWLLTRLGCIPVKRDKNPKKALGESMSALNHGEVLVVFPHGGIVPRNQVKSLKQGAFVLAKIAQVPLHSVFIEGVGARGFTILAVFIRSRVQIVTNKTIYRVTDDNLKMVMSEIDRFFKHS